MKKTVVIGKSSFLAGGVRALPETSGWIFLSSREIEQSREIIGTADIIINFAFAPEFSQKPYDPSYDIDSRLADMIHTEARYIMMSSRMVYGAQDDVIQLSENTPLNPSSVYGQNKLKIEKNLSSKSISKNLTILRLSNIFGFELGRKTFFGTALTNLLNIGQITFDIAPETVRDFLPLEVFSKHFLKIIQNPEAGIYNLGSGFGTSCRDVAESIIEGYGVGETVYTSNAKTGEFYLNMDKTRAAFDLPAVLKDDIKRACRACGEKLRGVKVQEI
jgi:UDP-glucose 4-epimerase